MIDLAFVSAIHRQESSASARVAIMLLIIFQSVGGLTIGAS
jgi:hypothetical protein